MHWLFGDKFHNFIIITNKFLVTHELHDSVDYKNKIKL